MHWIALLAAADSASATLPADPRAALAWWALSYTPRVAFSDEAVLMEISACERLWGGRNKLLELIFKQKRPNALVHGSCGATSLVAIGLLRLRVVGAPRPARVPDQLPLSTLDAARPHLDTLARIGCRTWCELRALPRAGVARRFGAGLLDALDCAWGQRPESHVWLTLPERFDQRFELPALAEHASALMFGAQRLLQQLRVWLVARQLGVVAFELTWFLDARRSATAAREQQLVVRTGQATQDMVHLTRLLSEQLARTTLPAPVQALRLRTLSTARLAPTSAMLLPEDRAVPASDASLRQLVERLSARLGPERVLRAVPCADHRPERRQRWEPAGQVSVFASHSIAENDQYTRALPRKGMKKGLENTAGADQPVPNGNLLPTWLLRDPLPLEQQGDRPRFHGPLQLLAGPDRLEAGWWVADEETAADPAAQPSTPEAALRDYFIARSEQAGLLWIYRERLRREAASATGGRWFLHGLYA